ncbi:MAG: hypothetical protein KY459_01670 [Acidobacteria bacterium]|nr:hypothetical protein [Acidobacteriota bacterium]
MGTITIELPYELERQVKRVVREGWYKSEENLIIEALDQFVGAKTYLGDSPMMLHHFAADALNDSKPEIALKFADRALTLAEADRTGDMKLYQSFVELKVQILLVLDRYEEASAVLDAAKERLPNNPAINRWIAKVRKATAKV